MNFPYHALVKHFRKFHFLIELAKFDATKSSRRTKANPNRIEIDFQLMASDRDVLKARERTFELKITRTMSADVPLVTIMADSGAADGGRKRTKSKTTTTTATTATTATTKRTMW